MSQPTQLRGDDDLHAILAAAEARPTAPTLDRRSFFKLAGSGLILAFHFGASALAEEKPAGQFAPNAFLRISPDGGVLIYSKAPEIGQGIKTAFPLIVAEELDADWARVTVEQAPIDPAVYGRQSAGGSRSIPTSWDQLRRAGAMARALLVSAAAREWNVPESEITTDKGFARHAASGRSLGYGPLAAKAATLPLPDPKTLKLKEFKDFRLLGRRVGGVDNHAIVTGQPLFGIDQTLPGLHYAAFEKCPATGGKVARANLDEIRRLPGVIQAFVVEGNGKPTEVMPGVAIVANSTWAAFSAKRQLKVEWDESLASKDDWAEIVAQATRIAAQPGAETLRNAGDVDAAFAGARTVESFYSYPFVPHAPLEPQNTTAWFRGDSVEIWAPTQTPDGALKTVAGVLGIAVEKVTIHQTRAGGGFGRRLMNDYLCEAAQISRQAGVPVKLQWTREDDMRHDFYRPAGFHAFKAALDANGRIAGWQDHFVTFTADGQRPVAGGDMPADEFPALLLPNVRLTQTKLPLQIPCGPWRAPRSNALAFVVQSFLHELAVAAKRDHLQFLLDLLGEPRWLAPGNEFSLNTGRAIGVLKLAAQKAGWGRPLPKGRALGLAFHFSHAGHFAEVAEVSVDADKRLKLHRVVVAGDIGPIVNLSGAENQVQGAVIDGFSTMLGLAARFERGRVEPANFDGYPVLRMRDAPQVEAHFIQSDFTPTGVGEPALPPVAPAICNAIFAATGQRVRRLPLGAEGFRT
ncbi:xanthine dehydrogenase family protein molybdopterin-binding subunit [Derxia lacustris]|uniref:xanthine dehydrogenase family protein molybdopterin-binding subunit n=1 Tax=Derxia lacustris TaxID=764842 RepID=UPI000A177EB9|nr:molybdopterin cofactor-binding domain-containing protein [Derxia lacustris]